MSRFFTPGVFGRLAVGFLAVVVLSGLALVPVYEAASPLASLEGIQHGHPWAWLWRGIHWFAALGLLVMTAVHIFEMIRRGLDGHLPAGRWWRSVMVLPAIIGAMLGGFVMRGDAGAGAALDVWRGIVSDVPGIGPEIATFTIGANEADLSTVALHHAGTFTVVIWLLSADHGRRLWPDLRSAVVAALSCLALAAVFPIGLGQPPGGEAAAIEQGPWYMLGLQGMLLDLPVASGWLVPLVGLGLLGAIRHAAGWIRRAIAIAVMGLVVVYVGWTIRLLGAA